MELPVLRTSAPYLRATIIAYVINNGMLTGQTRVWMDRMVVSGGWIVFVLVTYLRLEGETVFQRGG